MIENNSRSSNLRDSRNGFDKHSNKYSKHSNYTPFPPSERSPFSKAAGICQICGIPYKKNSWKCCITENGRVALCCNVPSEEMSRDGRRYKHFPKNSDFISKPAPSITNKPKTHAIADSAKQDAVYRSFLELLTLEPSHGDNLLYKRQLSDSTIVRNLYASVPTCEKAKEIMPELVKDLAIKGYDLSGVAGFFTNPFGYWNMALNKGGFYIPYFNAKGEIVGLQIRLDVPIDEDIKYIWFSSSDKPNGTAQTMPLHYEKPHLIKSLKEAYFTEGALKSQIIAERLNFPVIANAGTGIGQERAKEIANTLKCQFPELEKIILAPDADYREKKAVKAAFLNLKHAFKEAGFKVSHRKWDIKRGKGFDDVLNADSKLVGRIDNNG